VLDVAVVALIAGLCTGMYRQLDAIAHTRYAATDRVPGDSGISIGRNTARSWAFLWLLLIIAGSGLLC